MHSWNADEVGFVVSQRSLKLFSSKKTVRKNLADLPHFTAMIVTNALGAVGPKTMIFSDTKRRAVYTATTEDPNVLSAFNETGYMDQVLFRDWLMRFINFLDGSLFDAPIRLRVFT